MNLKETFGFERVHGRGTINSPQHTKIGKQQREGRPNSKSVKKRPNKNLWFKDQGLWRTDLDLEHGGSYDLVADEKEERVFAVDKNEFVHGFWDNKQQRGITFKKSLPRSIVVHPSITFKEYKKL